MLKTIALVVVLTTLGLSQTAPTGSPGEQLKQYLEQLRQNPNDDGVRSRIIELALTLSPKPVTPDPAWEASGKGGFLLENGKDLSDFVAGAAAFGQASLLAPWVADFYFNQGVLLERAELYREAIKSFRWYVTASPSSDDRADVLVRIGRLQALAERREQELNAKPEPELTTKSEPEPQPRTAAPDAERGHVETETAEPPTDLLRSLNGDYEAYACSYAELVKNGAPQLDRGCNEAEFKGGHWSKLGDYKLIVQRGQILIADNDSAFVTFVGTPMGPNASDMRWERFWPPVRIETVAHRRGGDVWARPDPDGSRLTLSNDRPIDNLDYNPRMRYHYLDLKRREQAPH